MESTFVNQYLQLAPYWEADLIPRDHTRERMYKSKKHQIHTYDHPVTSTQKGSSNLYAKQKTTLKPI